MKKLSGVLLKNYKKNLKLSSVQKALLIGSLLRDGSMRFSWNCSEANFIIDHSGHQKRYVYWKYQILKDWCLSSIIKTERTYHKNSERKLESFRFFTISHPELTQLYNLFYENGKKRVPSNIEGFLLDSFSLAVWVMDDGSRNKQALFLNTQGFSLNEQKILQTCLLKNFGLDSSLNVHSYFKGKKYYRIRLTTKSTYKLYLLVKENLIPSMHYKFPFYPRND